MLDTFVNGVVAVVNTLYEAAFFGVPTLLPSRPVPARPTLLTQNHRTKKTLSMLRILVYCLLGQVGALKLLLRVSALPAVVPTSIPTGATAFSTKQSVQMKHRLRMCQILAKEIRSVVPPVSKMRVHVCRRSFCDWVTALEVEGTAGITRSRLVSTRNVHDAVQAIRETANQVYYMAENAKAAGLVDGRPE